MEFTAHVSCFGFGEIELPCKAIQQTPLACLSEEGEDVLWDACFKSVHQQKIKMCGHQNKLEKTSYL